MSDGTKEGLAITAGLLVTAVVVIAVIFALVAGIKSFGRSQARANAKNQVSVTHIQIKNAEEKAKIVNAEIRATEAEARKRYQESIGIKEAQDEIKSHIDPVVCAARGYPGTGRHC